MLAQITALLALGVLCSSAPTSTPLHCSQVKSIINEVLGDVMNHQVNVTGSSTVPMDIKDKTCMHNNLRTFVKSLEGNPKNNSKASTQLNIIYKCKHLFPTVSSPQVPDKECRTARVSKQIFTQTLINYLKYLYGEI
ncbi:hypothetical protein ASZ78_000521 [Callipepla squamata]|uniref:Interleukin-4 n=1 Tax=Callipepla squamata TaxID=9009 RepID=A0A226MPR0_CALSU|nr:hypothetical protein ASZ78_000521 [Callipepla squamata]